jgi:hypothetical protein
MVDQFDPTRERKPKDFIDWEAADRIEQLEAALKAYEAEKKIEMRDSQLEDCGIDVYETAERIFDDIGMSHDFAHQGGLVFGSVNRIQLTQFGWRADPPYCTEKFLQRFREYQKASNPGGSN